MPLPPVLYAWQDLALDPDPDPDPVRNRFIQYSFRTR